MTPPRTELPDWESHRLAIAGLRILALRLSEDLYNAIASAPSPIAPKGESVRALAWCYVSGDVVDVVQQRISPEFLADLQRTRGCNEFPMVSALEMAAVLENSLLNSNSLEVYNDIGDMIAHLRGLLGEK